jgi:outer membrane immunogenic protein
MDWHNPGAPWLRGRPLPGLWNRGAGWGEFDSSATAAGVGTFSASTSHVVWVGGGGIEYGITPNVTARIEYLFLDTGNIPISTGLVGVTATGKVEDSIVRVGANFKF